MKKILFIHHATGWGGAPQNMINVIKSLDKSNYQIQVLLLKDSIVSKKLKENNISYGVAKSTFYKKYYTYFIHSEAGYVKWYQIFRFFRLCISWLLSRYYFAKKELKKYDYDIVHLNSSVLTDWLAPARQKGKVIIHIQEPFRNGKINVIASFFRYQMKKYADIIIAISEDNARRISLAEKTKVIYNFANIPDIKPPDKSYRSKSFLYLGGAAEIKGFYTLVEALDYLDEDVKIYFGGDYIESQKKKGFKQIIKSLIGYGKKRQIAINKMRSHPNAIEIGMTYQVDKYLNEVCCLISPFSIPHFARPVIEAHLHRKPAIGSNVEGMDEIIEHKTNGLLFEKNNAKKLAEAINYIAQHPSIAKIMGEQGYRVAKVKYSPENIKKIESIYSSLK